MKCRAKVIIFFHIISIGLIWQSCNPYKKIPEGKYLLTENKVISPKKLLGKGNYDLLAPEIPGIIKQKPNRKILGTVRFHLWMYLLSQNIKREKVRNWMTGIGEAPILLDSSLTEKSNYQIELFLNKKGYFNAKVTDSVSTANKRAKVYYKIDPGIPYTIRNFTIDIYDDRIKKLVDQNQSTTLIKKGMVYDEDILDKERERIVNYLKNVGFFKISPDKFNYMLDSNLNSKQIDVYLKLKNYDFNQKEKQYPQFTINSITFLDEFNPRSSTNSFSDTAKTGEIQYLFNNKMRFKPGVINNHIFMRKGDFYREKLANETYNKLSGMRLFRYTYIDYQSIETDSSALLNVVVSTFPLNRYSFSAETEGTNRSGILGLAGVLTESVKNPFRNADLLLFRIKASAEAASNLNTSNTSSTAFFNTFEIGPEISYEIPKFLLPFNSLNFSKFFNPKTILSASFNLQSIPDLTRNIINLSLGYSWKESTTKSHFFSPADLYFVKIDKKTEFSQFLQTLNNPFLLNTYIDHLNFGSKYTFTFNNQNIIKRRNFQFFRFGIESTGSLLELMGDNSLLPQNENGYYEILKIRFSHFIRTDFDFRYYQVINDKQSTVYRIAFGVARALRNLNVIPLERRYFGGGSNSIRAWTARSLGPGGFFDSTGLNIIRIGDLNLEMNLEYRFNLINVLKGALFLDAGNIWLINDDKLSYGNEGQFLLNKMISQIAVGGGLGLRFDFSFFIFRLDLGIKMRDPSIQENSGIVIDKLFDKQWKSDFENNFNQRYRFMSLNFGIGYPF